ncbi:AMP-binding protein [Bdellovibrio sp. HCB2-146]|uniref:AMP-binding protein n=1 Tax=Bdellovibrio sp. HCB2-146 TaxID=3394362 RepID=UPI0039BCE6DE
MSFRSEFEQARDFLILHRADYEYAYNNFRWPELENFNWALDYFDEMAAENVKTALWLVDESGKEERYSFLELSQRSNQVANYLRKLGVKKGDHLLLMVGNDVAQWEVLLASMKVGAIVVPTSSLLSAEELEDRLIRGSIRAIVTTKQDASRFNITATGIAKVVVDGAHGDWSDYAEATQESIDFVPTEITKATDPLLLYFTSGTTAKPKLVEHTHQSYPVGHLSTMYWIGLRPGDVHMNISSSGWAKHMWSNFFAPWNAEATVFIFKEARFDAKQVLQTLEKYKVTSLCAPPTVWRMFAAEDVAQYKMSFRELVSAGEPLEAALLQKIENAWGVPIRDGYGQTETTALIGNSPGQRIKENSVGRPLPGYRIKLLNREGDVSPEGEICVDLSYKALGLMSGYKEQTTETPNLQKEYYHTSDVGALDEDGYITFVGRVDEIFKCSDYRISPFELESVLLEHPAIREVAVIPSPDALRLNVPKAVVFLAKGFEPTKDIALSIMTHSRTKLAPFKRIRRVEFADLPKTSSGKIRRLELQLREKRKITTQEKSPYEFWEEDFKATLPEIWAQDLP